MPKTLVTLALCTAALAPSLSAQVAGPDSAAAAAVEVQLNHWLAAYESRDAEALARIFMETGIYAANTGEVLRGRDGIVRGVSAWFAAAPAAEVDLRREQVRFRVLGATAHELSSFSIRVVGPDCILDAGHALSVWREVDGVWLIETLLVNQDRSPPPGACQGASPTE